MLEGLEAKDLVSSILSTVTILVGIVTAYLTYTSQKRKEREAREQELEKARRDQRLRVYSEYLRVATGLNANAQKIVLDTEMDIMADFATGKIAADRVDDRLEIAHKLAQVEVAREMHNAHANLVTHGSQDVISRLSALYDCVEKHGQDQTQPETNRALLELIAAMRRDSFAKDYDGFVGHADNIVGAAAQARAQAFTARQAALVQAAALDANAAGPSD